MDILSFEPAVPDMNRRDLSLTDVLFRKPPAAIQGQIQIPRVNPKIPRGLKLLCQLPVWRSPTEVRLEGPLRRTVFPLGGSRLYLPASEPISTLM